MKKLFILLVSCFFFATCYAQEKAKVFPEGSPAPFLGLDDTSAPSQVKDYRASDINNIVLDNTGQASKRYGYAFHCDLDTHAVSDDYEAVTGIQELYKSSGTRVKVAVCGNKIFNVTTAGVKTDITNSVTITEGANYQFVWANALDYAIGTNFQDPIIKTNGSLTNVLDVSGLSSALTKAKSVVWWKNYLVVGNTVEAGTSHTTRVRWSNVGTIETWSDDDYVDIATLGGQQIEALSTLYDDLYIFLTDSIYKVSLVGGEELIKVTKVSEGVGCIAKNSVRNIAVGNSEGIIFLSRDKTVNFLDSVKVTDISALITNTMDDLSATRLQYSVAVDDRVNSHYYLSATNTTAAYNNLILDYHYGIGEWSKHSNIRANSIAVANDANEISQVYFGNYDSLLYQLQDEDKNSDCAGEVGSFDDRSITNTATASGLYVLYDNSATFTDVTGALVTITSGTGVDEVYTIVASTATGIVVVDSSITATGSSVYSIGSIDAYYTTKWYDLGVAPMRKNFGELFVWSSTDSATTNDIYYATDFVNTITSTTLATESSGSLWGTAIWGTSTWAGASTSLTRIPLDISGRFIKIKFANDNIDEPMDLDGYSLMYWDLSIL